MRTCPNCGCYVPDRWITCPACDARVKPSKEALALRPCHNTTSKVFPNGVYRVNIYYKDGSMDDALFEIYEIALKYAIQMSKRWYVVQFVEVWDYQTHIRLHLIKTEINKMWVH